MSFITKSELRELANLNIREKYGYYDSYSNIEKRASQILYKC